MDRLLISTHLHVLALILGVILVPVGVYLCRTRVQKKAAFTAEENNKLRLDIATLIPVGVLLWNLLIYYASNIKGVGATAVAQATPLQQATPVDLTFEKAVAAAGESTVALAAAIIFCRLFGGIWNDLSK